MFNKKKSEKNGKSRNTASNDFGKTLNGQLLQVAGIGIRIVSETAFFVFVSQGKPLQRRRYGPTLPL